MVEQDAFEGWGISVNDCMNRDALDFMSDEELACEAAAQPYALHILIRRYQNTVHAVANSLAQNSADADDFAEEGLWGLVGAATSFSPEKNISFKTFATVCIQNRIRSAYAKKCRTDGVQPVSLDEASEESLISDQASPELLYLQKERISELYERMRAVLSELEQEIFSLYLSGYSYAEIAKRRGISEKSVDNAILRGKRKLRAVWSRSAESE